MTTKDTINNDLKTAMLAGDKTKVTTLRGLKSAILYAEVAADKRDDGLEESAVIALLQKEAKKRQESIQLYRQGGNTQSADAEETELTLIKQYLPAELSEEEVVTLVQQQATALALDSPGQMGQLIAAVKQASGGSADGAMIAKIVKEFLHS